MFNKKHLKVAFKALIVLIIINTFYAFFLFQREYEPVIVELDITSEYQTNVWLSYKAKYDDSIYLSAKKIIKKDSISTISVEIDNKYGNDFIGLNWNYSNKGKFYINNIRFKNKDKIKEYSNPEVVVNYASNNLSLVTTKKGVYAESNANANGWIILETFPIYKISRVKLFHPISIIGNCILFLLIYLIIHRQGISKNIFYNHLLIKGSSFQKIRTYLLILWALLLPFWINISHILAIVLFVISLVHFFKKREDFNFSILKYFWGFPLFFLSIVAVNVFFHLDNTLDDFIRFSYFIIVPVIFLGLPKINLKKIIYTNQVSILGYVLLLIIATAERYFSINNNLSFDLVFINTIETYWHTSYLAGLLIINLFFFLINTRLKIIPLIASVFVFYFVYLSDARLPLITGLALFLVIIINKQFDLKIRKNIFLFASILLLVSVLFLANNKKSQEYLANNFLKTKTEKIDSRINLWKSGEKIISKHYLWGIGNNDIKSSLSSNLENSSKIKFRDYNAHNQYLELLLGYGIFPLLFFVLLLFYPVIQNKNFNFNLFILYFSIAMLVESYLARQAGIIIFTYWYCLLIVYNEKN